MEQYCPYCMEPLTEETPCTRCGKKPEDYIPSVHHLPPDTLLQGRYRIGRVLGEGGFGITYLGLDENLGRLVAVKEYFPTSFVLRENSVSLGVTCYTSQGKDFYEKGRDQFLQEARTMARLDKAQEIVRVMDFFSANNTAYLVMEFLEGETLKELVAHRGPIPAKELLDLMRPVVAAVGTIHQAGILHRDISPDNVMVLKDGGVKLMDFGCARELEGGRTMTVVLKHGFAPLEQYTGRGQGPWSDVYSLSATLYYCLTGKVPPRAVERSEEADELVSPTRLGAELTPRQERALLKGLGVHTRDRWQSAEEFYGALYGVKPDGSPWEEPTAEEIEAGRTEYVSPKGKSESKDHPEQREEEPSPSRPVHSSPVKETSVRWKFIPKYTKVVIGSAACLAIIALSLLALGGAPFSPSLQESGEQQSTQPVSGSESQSVDPEDTVKDEEAIASLPELPENMTGQDPPAAGVQPEQPPSSPEKTAEKEETSGGSHASQQPAQPQTPQQPVQTAQELYEAGKAANERKDYSTAASLFRQADDKGDTYAAYRLADVGYYGYWEDLGDKDTALSLIREAYQRGAAGTEIAPYIRRIGRSFEREEQHDTAAPLLEEAAEMGDLEAMLVLGKMYLYGDGVATSNDTAAYWILKSAQGGNVAAYYDAGVLYQYGWGVEKDWDKARSWYQKALDSDYSTGKSQAQRALDEMDAAQAP